MILTIMFTSYQQIMQYVLYSTALTSKINSNEGIDFHTTSKVIKEGICRCFLDSVEHHFPRVLVAASFTPLKNTNEEI